MNQSTRKRIEALEASSGPRRFFIVDDAQLWPECYTSEQAERLASGQDTIIKIEWIDHEIDPQQ